MAMPAGTIKEWLNLFSDDTEIAIDEGGLALVLVNDEETYLEVGGEPFDEMEEDQ